MKIIIAIDTTLLIKHSPQTSTPHLRPPPLQPRDAHLLIDCLLAGGDQVALSAQLELAARGLLDLVLDATGGQSQRRLSVVVGRRRRRAATRRAQRRRRLAYLRQTGGRTGVRKVRGSREYASLSWVR